MLCLNADTQEYKISDNETQMIEADAFPSLEQRVDIIESALLELILGGDNNA